MTVELENVICCSSQGMVGLYIRMEVRLTTGASKSEFVDEASGEE